MLEFTGERVVPGLVDPNLLNEHLARYKMAARYAAGAAVLDAGCGSGYGTSELSAAASVVAMDISHEALRHAAEAYGREGLRFAEGSLEALPFADASFDLVLAFEVIEHLEHWEEMLREARRVLRPSGTLLVSTPNKSYYNESRGSAGANPFHTHEFEYDEFRAALEAVFPRVHLWSQNRTEAIAFVPLQSSAGTLDAAGDAAPGEAHFYLAACGAEPIRDTSAFGWLPETGNLLREREHHIELLTEEIARKDGFVGELQGSQAELMRAQEAVNAELQRANAWGAQLTDGLRKAGERVVELQGEIDTLHAGYQGRIRILSDEAESRLMWVQDLEGQIGRGRAEIARLEELVEERTRWAQSLDEDVRQLRERLGRVRGQLHAAARSKWVRAGRAIHLGPVIDAE